MKLGNNQIRVRCEGTICVVFVWRRTMCLAEARKMSG